MSGEPDEAQVENLTPEQVAEGIKNGTMLLVDVREPNETAVERYPDPEGKRVVFACRSGRRSVTASLAAQEAGCPYNAHLAGGILAWKAAGFDTVT